MGQVPVRWQPRPSRFPTCFTPHCGNQAHVYCCERFRCHRCWISHYESTGRLHRGNRPVYRFRPRPSFAQ